jgi:hypothetical protein
MPALFCIRVMHSLLVMIVTEIYELQGFSHDPIVESAYTNVLPYIRKSK